MKQKQLTKLGIFVLFLLSAHAIVAQRRMDKQIGQMIMVGFRGMDAPLDSPIIRDIRRFHLGGIVLFDYDVKSKQFKRNIESPTQVRKLTLQLQAASKTPLLIGIDQEGGMVNRLKANYGFPGSISADSLGKINNLDTTQARANTIARTLKSAGINVNFAPDVDLAINPDNPVISKKKRSFGSDPALVGAHAMAYIQAHHDAGVLTAIKHFPGHGSSLEDTHTGYTDVTKQWQRSELEPFRKVIQSGQCDIVMTSHIFNANLDPNYPATLSYPTITGILRNELGWKGVVISDDMQMGALANNYGFEKSLELVILAGADILLLGNNLNYDPDIAEKTFRTVKKLVKEGKISKKRIRQSYKRIKRLKRRM